MFMPPRHCHWNEAEINQLISTDIHVVYAAFMFVDAVICDGFMVGWVGGSRGHELFNRDRGGNNWMRGQGKLLSVSLLFLE